MQYRDSIHSRPPQTSIGISYRSRPGSKIFYPPIRLPPDPKRWYSVRLGGATGGLGTKRHASGGEGIQKQILSTCSKHPRSFSNSKVKPPYDRDQHLTRACLRPAYKTDQYAIDANYYSLWPSAIPGRLNGHIHAYGTHDDGHAAAQANCKD